MATSGSFTSTFGTNNKYTLKATWTRNSYDVAANKSNVTVTAYLISGGSSYNINSSVTKNGTITINGTSYSFTFSCALTGGQTRQIVSKTVDIYHNSDGTKSFGITVKGTIGITFSSGKVNDISVSGTATLDTIPRTSSMSLSTTSATLGSTNVTVTISRASSSFTHKVYYKFGSNTTTPSSNAATSCSFTPALSLATQIPNATSGTATVYVETYSGSTKIGTVSKTMTFTVPSSVKPTISSLSAAVVADGAATSYGYVQGKSKCKLTINGAAGSQGSTIKSYKITGNGSTFTASSGTTGNLNKSGTFTYTATVTDSRGRTSDAKTVSISVQAYSAPSISAFSAKRCNSSGTAATDGTYVSVSATFSCTSLGGKNTASGTLTYKTATATSYSSLGSITSGSTKTYGSGGIAVGNAYNIQLTVKDTIGTSVTKVVNISPQFALLDFKSGGTGMAIGKYAATNNTLEIALRTYVYANINTYTLAPVTTGTYYCGTSSLRWQTVYAVNALNTSDVRYKENIVPIREGNAQQTYSLQTNDEVTLTDMRDFIKNDCNLFKYNYKEQDHEEFGFIAQDIVDTKVGRKIIIGEEDEEGGYSYSTGSYIGVVVGALQEEIKIRDAEIEEQKQINEELNNKVDELEGRLKNIEKLLSDNE